MAPAGAVWGASSSGVKRKPEDAEESPLQLTFSQYAAHLDAINEKRERLVKASRDITTGSKKVIFAVHRANSPAGLAHAAGDLEAVRLGHIGRVAKELSGSDYYRFSRSFSIGIQEFVEAATFVHWCQEGSLLTLESLNRSMEVLKDADGRPFFVSDQDYLLGLADLTGEVMRLAVSGSFARTETNAEACRLFVQKIYANFLTLSHPSEIGKDFSKKTDVMRQSLQKIEHVAYALHVRGSEYPPEMLLRSLDGDPPERADHE